MSWDHRAAYGHILGNAAQGQQAEGGYNRDNNCVPTTGCDIARAYGGPNLHPQDLTDAAYGRGWHGGEDYEPMIAALRARWADCPAVTYSTPPDTLAGVDAEASQGHAIGCSLHCDGYGTIQTRVTGIRHVCTLVAHVDGQVHVMNSERNNLVVLSEAEFAAATSGAAGQLFHFQRPLPTGLQGDDDLTPAQDGAAAPRGVAVRPQRAGERHRLLRAADPRQPRLRGRHHRAARRVREQPSAQPVRAGGRRPREGRGVTLLHTTGRTR
jgi:hypothetical protein